ncbi:LytR/AlgR family response regulator transcription factor [Phocaeicola oris]|uniref:LytR/AlgR family response regulator transcription factor n=1 Tax=Phocaeicola oris TaxID=2896850 RepID=UPI00234F8549|nr:LytTR family DNA-binding domain-containing protein [Phocaeicola oris]MCE2616474.1 LytTR family DNA-binding domain-containing protein [Phocaeicola oris]
MVLNCIIVDDEPLALQLLETYVNKTPFLNLVGTFSNAVKAMNKLNTLSKVDLLFLDIQMPELSGLEFSKMISPQTRIIFTTAFSQYAIDSYKVNALDYLLKPFSYADFLNACNKAVQWFEIKQRAEGKDGSTPAESVASQQNNSKDFIYVKSDYKLIQIPLKSILYIEGLKDYVKIHIENQDRPILSMITLKSLEEKLPSMLFIRVHRSFIVQKAKIKMIDHGRIVFGKEYIPVSDSYKDALQKYLDSKTI